MRKRKARSTFCIVEDVRNVVLDAIDANTGNFAIHWPFGAVFCIPTPYFWRVCHAGLRLKRSQHNTKDAPGLFVSATALPARLVGSPCDACSWTLWRLDRGVKFALIGIGTPLEV
jgi:hypothetical protein